MRKYPLRQNLFLILLFSGYREFHYHRKDENYITRFEKDRLLEFINMIIYKIFHQLRDKFSLVWV